MINLISWLCWEDNMDRREEKCKKKQVSELSEDRIGKDSYYY